ncbi:MAG: NepR family anti-sigma factor [Parvibaculaceae bacterium]
MLMTTRTKREGPPLKPPALDHESQAQIGRMLKAMYDEVADEQVPDKFVELLRQLEASESEKK